MHFKVENEWVEREFREVDFGDERLNRRFIKTAKHLSNYSELSINQACQSLKDAKGAYRMFDNDNVNTEEILKAHYSSTRSRVKGMKRVFAIQDTSFLDYNTHKETSGLGSIGKNCRNKSNILGLIFHSCLLISEDNIPLGFLSQEIASRAETPESRAENKQSLKKKTIYEKESYKWLKAFSETKNQLPESVDLINISDRESDIHEYMQEVTQAGEGFVIRSARNRKVDREDELSFLKVELLLRPLAGRVSLEVKSKHGEKPRLAKLEIRYGNFDLVPPHRYKSAVQEKLMDIPISAISIQEVEVPEGEEAIDWSLLTNLPVETLDDAVEKIEFYKLRWNIEVFHKILKSGCGVEKCRLEDAERLKKYIAIMTVIALRIFQLTKLSRQEDDIPCTEVLSQTEWKALYFHAKESIEFPKDPPTLKQATMWIGKLGGHLGRKGDGHPGVTVLWRGWKRMKEIEQTILTFSKLQPLIFTSKDVGKS